MVAKLLQVEPTTLDFGEIQVGGVAVHHLIITNNTPDEATFHLRAHPTGNGADFNIVDLTDNTLAPFSHREITVAFCPMGFGQRQHHFAVHQVGPQGSELVETIALSGTGSQARRHSFRAVSLPPRQGEKQGFHYVLSVSDNRYLQCLEKEMGHEFDWYAAIPSGTRKKKVSLETELKPGELLLHPNTTALNGISILNCFDIQTIHINWLTRIHSTVTDQRLLSEMNEAMGHATGLCQNTPEKCRHEVLCEEELLPYYRVAPEAGQLIKIKTDEYISYYAIISPRLITARYYQCFKKYKMALTVRVDKAKETDKTTNYGVYIEPTSDKGALWAPCYTASILNLQDTHWRRVTFLDRKLSPEELVAVQERVRLYLGLEE